MNYKITTALSVVGVLSAGTAAAAVNTTILDRPDADSSAVSTPFELTVPATTAPPPTTARPATTIAVEVVTVTNPPPPTTEPSAYLTTFTVGDAGNITVDFVDDQLTIVELQVADGWDGTAIDTGDASTVGADFASGTLRVQFVATIADGVITPQVTSSSTELGPIIEIPAESGSGSGSSRSNGSSGSGSATPAPAPAPAPSNGGDDYDDDDDEHEGRDDDSRGEDRDDGGDHDERDGGDYDDDGDDDGDDNGDDGGNDDHGDERDDDEDERDD